MLLPINSVINPVLYNAKIGKILSTPGRVVIRTGRRAVAYFLESSTGGGAADFTRRETATDLVKGDTTPIPSNQIVETENL